MTDKLNDKLKGMLLGLAVGDAVGTTNEFKHNPLPIDDMVGGGPFKLNAGEWTDDTSMALCLADSLISRDGFDPSDQMVRYVSWYKHGHNSVNGVCFDIGGTTSRALDKFILTGEPYCGDTMNSTAGNGSLMRLAPVIMYYWNDREKAKEYAEKSSFTTHGAPQCVSACKLFCDLIFCILDGKYSKEDGFDIGVVEHSYHPRIKELMNYNYTITPRESINPSGYVVDSLEAAVWCFENSSTFKEGCLLAANLGGDADTIAAIYGQLAGAYYGMSAIPSEWLDKLAWKDHIETIADILINKKENINNG